MWVNRILSTLIMLYLPMADALASPDLYSGEVVVSDQSDTKRTEAIPEALIQVLQKLSGQREMPISPTFDVVLGNAEKMLRSFRYQYVERNRVDGTKTRELQLISQFIQVEVDRAIQQIGLPRWQKERSPVQIWVIIDDGDKRKLQPVEFDYAWESMADVAAMRGLPVSWPDLDEEELQLLDMRLVWGGYTDYLVEKGAPPDGVMIVSAMREGPEWRLRWNLGVGDQLWSWRNSDQELMFALAEGIHKTTDFVASINTIEVSEQGISSVDVTVRELRDAIDYAHCLEYLQDQSIVTRVEILGADPGRVHFRLQLNASSEYLISALDRGSVLLPSDHQEGYEYEFLHK